MFSGLISHRGWVERVEILPQGGCTLRVRCEGADGERVEPKDSVAIDGVCLSATAVEGESVRFDVVPETLARTTLGSRRPGDCVNVEYSLRLGDRLGGHFVYGHVDGTAAVIARAPEGQGERLRVELPAPLARFVCEKAYVSLDGVSLTVAAAGPGWFEVALVPETLKRTTLANRRAGDRVNLEVDPLARYAVEAALHAV